MWTERFAWLSITTPLRGNCHHSRSLSTVRVHYSELSCSNNALADQLAVLEAQLDLAVELGRNVSLHSVKCPQGTVDLLNKLKLKHGQQFENIRSTSILLRVPFSLLTTGTR